MKSRTIHAGRRTRQREALQAVLERADRPLTVGELLDAAAKRIDGLGIATVYRTVRSLLDEGLIVPVEMPGETARYERAGKEHHHHFQCERCDRVFDLTGCFENVRKFAPPKFRVKEHALNLYGLCASCAR